MSRDRTPLDPDAERRVRSIFESMPLMETLGARLTELGPGAVTLEMPVTPAFTQQNGFVHAGIVASLADTACGCAAGTLLAAGNDVLAVEFKLNLLAPTRGERVIARARVIRAGRLLSICQADVFALRDGGERHTALMTSTIIGVERPGSGSGGEPGPAR